MEYKESVKGDDKEGNDKEGDDKEGDDKEGDEKEKREKKGLKVKKGVKKGEENEEMYNDMKAEEADNIYKAIDKDDKNDKDDKDDKDDKESDQFYEGKSYISFLPMYRTYIRINTLLG